MIMAVVIGKTGKVGVEQRENGIRLHLLTLENEQLECVDLDPPEASALGLLLSKLTEKTQ